MNARRLILLVGAVLLAVGVIALLMPVSITGDGNSIGCGNAIAADSAEAEAANNKTVANVPILNQIVPHTDYVANCQAAVSSRRTWSIPLTVVGALAVLGSFAAPRSRTVS
ncbi:aminopeptidase [Mycolicibacterium stellerae]|uniref:aminopeptidase n=1 Tax=Mycolicibacterium stellerae TaxID=2358193 RepID=UPI000F0BA3BF|nr:aminopeptidase [Mycolicibacterium stellerae]